MLDDASEHLDPASVGAQLGPYRIEALLSHGGMGVVYRALDIKLNRPVAVKFLSSGVADPTLRRRFQREAQTASSLNHPHILTVHDAGEWEGRQYLVTEFVDGGTLKDWAAREKPDWRQIVELLTGVADGLAAAHDAGILHRDIKPDNILVAKNGYAKLGDFGLAKVEAPAQDGMTRTLTGGRTRPGVILGTVVYMSPEQAAGQPLDARSDIFSFGVVLYELLARRRPFDRPTDVETLHAVMHDAPPSIATLCPDVPAGLQMTVEKALEKNPSDRYQSMRDMLVDLRRALRQSSETPMPRKPANWARPWMWATVVAVVAALAGAGWILFRSRPAASPLRSEYIPLTNFADSAVAPSLSPDGRMLAFIRGDNPFIGPGDVYVKLLPNGDPVRLTHNGAAKEGPVVFSPDGGRIAYAEGDVEEAWTIPVLGGEPTRLLAKASGLSWVKDSPGEHRVMFSAVTGQGIHMGVYVSSENRAEQRTVYLPANENGMAHRSFLSPDGKWVLVVEMDLGTWLPCRLVPFDGSSAGNRIGPQPAQCTDAAWSPDGKWMYMSANTGDGFHIWRQRYPSGVPEQITSGATEEQGLSFAPDGGSFVTSVGTSQSTLWVHDRRGDQQVTSEGFAFLSSFSADGKTLFYLVRSRASRRFVSGELWASNLETGHSERLLSDFLMEHYNVSPDGKSVVFLNIDDAGRSAVWLAPIDGSIAPRRLASVDYASHALFQPQGGVLFVGGERGAPFLYRVNLDGTGLQKVLPRHVSFLYSVSPSGRAVALWVDEDVYVYRIGAGVPTLICEKCGTAGEENRGVTPPLVSWSPDEKFLYVHSTRNRKTYAVPLRLGQLLPALPAGGLSTLAAAGTLPGAITIPEQRAYGGADPSVYAFPRVSTHRNIYRILIR